MSGIFWGELPNHREKTDEFCCQLIDIRDELRHRYFDEGVTDDPKIYHYTSPDGLIGILTNAELWATSIRNFKDQWELLHAEAVFLQVLDEIAKESPPCSSRSKLVEACRIDPPFSTHPRSGPLDRGSGKCTTWLNKVLDIYVVCFSTNSKLLHQWKNYACGGAGFSIGFDRRQLREKIQPPPVNQNPKTWDELEIPYSTHLVKVRYSEQLQKAELKEIFERFSSVITDDMSVDQIDCCAEEIVNSVALHASLFKHPSFEPENEWRIIIETLGGRSDVSFRSSPNNVIPFRRVKPEGGKFPLCSISIGPGMDPNTSRSVQDLLDTKGYQGVRIIACTGLDFQPT